MSGQKPARTAQAITRHGSQGRQRKVRHCAQSRVIPGMNRQVGENATDSPSPALCIIKLRSTAEFRVRPRCRAGPFRPSRAIATTKGSKIQAQWPVRARHDHRSPAEGASHSPSNRLLISRTQRTPPCQKGEEIRTCARGFSGRRRRASEQSRYFLRLAAP